MSRAARSQSPRTAQCKLLAERKRQAYAAVHTTERAVFFNPKSEEMAACTARLQINFAHLSQSDENAHTLKTQLRLGCEKNSLWLKSGED